MSDRSRPVVAIDGPSGAGKSTVARGLAAALGFAYVDTGALYRAVALLADQSGVSWDDGPALAQMLEARSFSFDAAGNLRIDGTPLGDSIRSERMSRGASTVSRHPEVRRALLEVQRAIGSDGGVVLEGRDIGTVVFPDAEIKFFLRASLAVRAARRHAELAARGEHPSLSGVERDLAARDERDRTREVSPLVRADDAIDVVCDDLSAEEVIQKMLSHLSSPTS